MELELVIRAAAFAAKAHERQKRKASDQPYVNHLLRVAHHASLARLPAESVAAAALHDVIEDTSVGRDELERHFPARVVELVVLLTKPRSGDKAQYYAGILLDQEAVELKLLDRADNLFDMLRVLPKEKRWAKNYYEKTKVEVTAIRKASRNEYAQKTYDLAMTNLGNALR